MNFEQLRVWLRSSPAQRRALVMGVLNVTPDSFSDGGAYGDVSAAVSRAIDMEREGADLIDIGGESTRPGSMPITAAEQVRRVVPVIEALRKQSSVVISIDTTSALVAKAALEAGANLVNDISAGWNDAGMFGLVASKRVPIVLMHMQGTPATMQVNPSYRNVVEEVCEFLKERRDSATSAGVDRADVLFDPGFGFGKTVQHNLLLLKHIHRIVDIGQAVVVGTSRKGFIGKVTGETDTRLMGTAATVGWAVANGAGIVRVHDVKEMVRTVRMVGAIRDADGNVSVN